MASALNDPSLDQIFRSARTFNSWADRPVEDAAIREIYDLLKWGPTSANSSPARFVWVRSADGKAKLAGLAAELNKPKILKAPVTVIIGHDLDFAAKLPKLMPHAAEAMQKYFAAPGMAEVTAMRNGTLQGAYLIVAARALASALVMGSGGAEAFAFDTLGRPDIGHLRQRVRVKPYDGELPPPNDRPARAEVRLRDGRVLSAECLSARGGADRPLPPSTVDDKIAQLAAPVYPQIAATLAPLRALDPTALQRGWRQTVDAFVG